MPEWPVTKAAFYWFSCILTWDMTLLRGQAAEAQSSSYCYSTQRHTVKDNYRHYCARRPKYPYYWRGKGGKVSTPSSWNQKIHRTTRVKVIPIPIGALGTISGNVKGLACEVESTRYFWKSTYSCQPSLVLPISCGKCDVSKLQDFCRDVAENSQKKNWRGSHHNNNNKTVCTKRLFAFVNRLMFVRVVEKNAFVINSVLTFSIPTGQMQVLKFQSK